MRKLTAEEERRIRLEEARAIRTQERIKKYFPEHKGDRLAGRNSWNRHLHIRAMKRYKANKFAKQARKKNRGN
jgi:hypothetical protein